jgi:pre-mRNA-splicing factor CWC22
VVDEPPSTRHRSQSPSDAVHEVEPRSTKDATHRRSRSPLASDAVHKVEPRSTKDATHCRSCSLSDAVHEVEPRPTKDATCCRSPSPSDAVHEVEPRSTKDAFKDKHLEACVTAIELSKSDSNEKDTEKTRETTQRAEFAKLLNTRSGGMYIPPARLRAMQEAASSDKTSAEYQRLSWDALCKSITGIVNRVNITNIKQIIPELFSENLICGRGLFARSIMKPQAASLPFTPVFAALVAIINAKLPQVGELVLARVISQFRKSFKRNNKVGSVFFFGAHFWVVDGFSFYLLL